LNKFKNNADIAGLSSSAKVNTLYHPHFLPESPLQIPLQLTLRQVNKPFAKAHIK